MSATSTDANRGGADDARDVVISCRRMTRLFGSLKAVDSLSLEVRRGEMFGLIGPDGAGKTTTIRMILGLLACQEGQILTCGLDPVRRRRELSRRVGYLSQRFTLYGDLSCDENIAFFAEIHGARRWQARRDELLEWLRLAPFRERLAERLSGGMKQKLALACTLIHTPELLVLDEPTTGVDPVSRREFWRSLAALQREGMTIFLTTPYLDEAERCQRVAMMAQGRLLALDTPEALRGRVRGAMCEVIASPKRQAQEWLKAHPQVDELEIFGERFHITFTAGTTDAAAQSDRLAAGLRQAGVEVESTRVIPPSLEDAFIARLRSPAPETEVTP